MKKIVFYSVVFLLLFQMIKLYANRAVLKNQYNEELNGLPKKQAVGLLAKEESIDLINKEGMTIGERYLLPEGYIRTEEYENSFAYFLRNQKLKEYGERVFYYDGREKKNPGIYSSVLDVDIGNRDLHQCADAIMLLRAEYLYSIERYDEINFNFVSGFKAEYSKWMEGYRIKVDGNNVSYSKSAEQSNTYEDFRRFMDMVFSYSSTISLNNELKETNIEDMKIGDVFIVAGNPGHAIIIMDMAVDIEENRLFLLAQSYMPAQQTQILLNPMNDKISPWYSLEGEENLITPEWTFKLDEIKKF